MASVADRIAEAVRLLKESRRVVAFTGAGISTESGIADFRSPGGVWDRYRIVTFQEFLASSEARVEYWRMKQELFSEMKNAKPNAAHLALAELERKGILQCLITQNIDGLHQDAGSAKVIELHGTNRKACCLDCDTTWPFEEIQARLEAGDTDPRCSACGGLVKPATISFGQAMPEKETVQAFEHAARSDLLIMAGSSLQVEPAASIPREAAAAGAKLIFVNRTETPWDSIATLLFRESAGTILSAVVKGVNMRRAGE